MVYFQVRLTPISFPIPKVTAAAARPKKTCLKPENQTFLFVNNVIAAPIRNKPTMLNTTLRMMALLPVVKIKGANGMIAPIENKTKE